MLGQVGEMGGARSAHWGDDKHDKILVEKSEKRDYSGDLSVEGRIILKFISGT
jgi:hypothetical protein